LAWRSRRSQRKHPRPYASSCCAPHRLQQWRAKSSFCTQISLLLPPTVTQSAPSLSTTTKARNSSYWLSRYQLTRYGIRWILGCGFAFRLTTTSCCWTALELSLPPTNVHRFAGSSLGGGFALHGWSTCLRSPSLSVGCSIWGFDRAAPSLSSQPQGNQMTFGGKQSLAHS